MYAEVVPSRSIPGGDFRSPVIVPQDFGVRVALLGHSDSTGLRQPHAVAEPAPKHAKSGDLLGLFVQDGLDEEQSAEKVGRCTVRRDVLESGPRAVSHAGERARFGHVLHARCAPRGSSLDHVYLRDPPDGLLREGADYRGDLGVGPLERPPMVPGPVRFEVALFRAAQRSGVAVSAKNFERRYMLEGAPALGVGDAA